ncbi:MAG: hypothetical protein D6730_22915 [Bacteroidetes bacterium]|nr:MAG: hypothetical protein D6730_22915 [Bacteroidota bacterium]
MKSQLTTLIPMAIQVIEDVNIPSNKQKREVPSVYNGYVSSLGAGIVQAGLLPAVIFFENSEGEGQKYKVTQAIRLLMERETKGEKFTPSDLSTDNYRLSAYILDERVQNDARFLRKVSTMAVAIKIALRTFKKIES